MADGGGARGKAKGGPREGGSAEVPPASLPLEFGRNLRACVPCRLLKTFDQFVEEGCENCFFLNMRDDPERVAQATTTSFNGVLAQMEPGGSWVGKWSQLNKFAPGCYAMACSTELPVEIEQLLEDNNITWHKR